MLSKVGVRCGVYPVAALAQVNIIEVSLQDFLFGVVFLKLQGPENLHDLSLDGYLIVIGHIFNELLGDGGAPLNVTAGEHQQDSFCGTNPVHSVVVIESLVLDGYGGVLQVLRDLREIDPNAVFTAI